RGSGTNTAAPRLRFDLASAGLVLLASAWQMRAVATIELAHRGAPHPAVQELGLGGRAVGLRRIGACCSVPQVPPPGFGCRPLCWSLARVSELQRALDQRTQKGRLSFGVQFAAIRGVAEVNGGQSSLFTLVRLPQLRVVA